MVIPDWWCNHIYDTRDFSNKTAFWAQPSLCGINHRYCDAFIISTYLCIHQGIHYSAFWAFPRIIRLRIFVIEVYCAFQGYCWSFWSFLGDCFQKFSVKIPLKWTPKLLLQTFKSFSWELLELSLIIFPWKLPTYFYELNQGLSQYPVKEILKPSAIEASQGNFLIKLKALKWRTCPLHNLSASSSWQLALNSTSGSQEAANPVHASNFS